MCSFNDVKNGMIVGAVLGTMAGTAAGIMIKMKKKPCSPMKKKLHKACSMMEDFMKSMSDMTK
ncbi:MAG: hypothetical protein E7623_05820 [Ruminococcaceae bacterium]|nr:hypothetical protein [Oscillospiraceae bacterium]